MPGLEYFLGHERFSILAELLMEGLRAADPAESVKRVLESRNHCISVAGETCCDWRKIHVIGFGKASRRMAEGVLDALGDLVSGGVVIAPRGQSGRVGTIEVLEGDHPVPGEATLRSSRKLLEYIEANIGKDDLVIVLISGGGSALFEVPADEISLDEIAFITRELLRRGADIYELNAVRKHLSSVKGGQLARLIRAKMTYALIISDVVGNRLDTIASGPLVPDETTFSDAIRVLKKYGLWDEAPSSIRGWLEKGARGEVEDTPKPGDPLFERVKNIIVADNLSSLRAMMTVAAKKGYNVVILTSRLRGEAREVAKALAAIIESTYYDEEPIKPPAILLAGGETVVTVKGKGVGGRNQELCLALMLAVDRGVKYRAACMGSDGIDGVSPAAGAIIDESLLAEAGKAGLNPSEYLENNDSYTFFSKLGRTIDTGYTGTNVNDFFIAVIESGR